MPRRVEFQGVTHEFPDNATDDQVAKALKSFAREVPAAAQPPEQKPTGETFLGELGAALNPVTAVKGLAHAVMHPVDTAKAAWNAQTGQWEKAKEAASQGRYSEAAGHGLAAALPVVGPAAAEAGEAIGGTAPKYDKFGNVIKSGSEPNLGAGLGKAAGVVAGVAGPTVAKQVITKAPLAGQMGKAAESIYRGALRPPAPRTAAAAEKIKDTVTAGLEQKIPITEKGISKLSRLIEDYNQAIESRIATNPNAPIQPSDVARRVSDAKQKFQFQATPVGDLGALSTAENEFMSQWGGGGPISAETAQAIKKGTYRKIERQKKTAYEGTTDASIEAQKALARGLKEELEAHFPEIKGLNAKEAQAIGLQDLLERAVGREENVGLGLPAARATPHGMVAGVINSIARFPGLRSKIAIALYEGSKKTRTPLTLPAATARVNLLFGESDEEQPKTEAVPVSPTQPPPTRSPYGGGPSARRPNPF